MFPTLQIKVMNRVFVTPGPKAPPRVEVVQTTRRISLPLTIHFDKSAVVRGVEVLDDPNNKWKPSLPELSIVQEVPRHHRHALRASEMPPQSRIASDDGVERGLQDRLCREKGPQG